jgi:hypothetical protein
MRELTSETPTDRAAGLTRTVTIRARSGGLINIETSENLATNLAQVSWAFVATSTSVEVAGVEGMLRHDQERTVLTWVADGAQVTVSATGTTDEQVIEVANDLSAVRGDDVSPYLQRIGAPTVTTTPGDIGPQPVGGVLLAPVGRAAVGDGDTLVWAQRVTLANVPGPCTNILGTTACDPKTPLQVGVHSNNGTRIRTFALPADADDLVVQFTSSRQLAVPAVLAFPDDQSKWAVVADTDADPITSAVFRRANAAPATVSLAP